MTNKLKKIKLKAAKAVDAGASVVFYTFVSLAIYASVLVRASKRGGRNE